MPRMAEEQTTSINNAAASADGQPAGQSLNPAAAPYENPLVAGDPAASSEPSRPAKRAAPGQGEAPAHDEPNDDRFDQLTGMITSLAQQNAALTAQVSALTGNLAQLMPSVQQLPAATAAMSTALEASGTGRGNSQTSQLTAKSIECVDNAIKSSVNRLRAINTARHLATDGRKAMAALDPAKTSEPMPACLPKELRSKEPRITRGGSLPASAFADLQEQLLVKQRNIISHISTHVSDTDDFQRVLLSLAVC